MVAAERSTENSEKSQLKAASKSPHVDLDDMKSAQANDRAGSNSREAVVDQGQMKIRTAENLYGPEGVNRDLAAPLVAAARAREGGPDRVAPVVNPTDQAARVGDRPMTAAEVQGQKTRLEALTAKMTPDQRAEVEKDMKAIENRNPPLRAEQVNKIYESTSKLLEDPEHSSRLSQAERNQLAAGILHNASLRTGTDQGFHNTCNVTTLERRLNTLNPEEAARIVSEVGLTNKYTAKDGKVIDLSDSNMRPDAEASLQFGDKRTDGRRNYASQVFDQAAVNDYWQRQNPPLKYTQETPTGPRDTGERLRFPDGREVNGPDGKPMRQPALSVDAMGQIGKHLGFEGSYIIANADVAGAKSADGTTKVHNYQEFSDALSKNKPPAVIMVNSNDQMFGGTGDKGGAGGWHVVTVSDYQAGPPPKVFMNNQWGSENNKWVNVGDLYNATLPNNNGRVDSGSGDRRNGGDQGGGQNGHGDQGSGDRGGHSSRGGVMRDEDFRKFKSDVVDQFTKKPESELKKSDEDPKKPLDQNNHYQLAPLQSLLQTAISNHDQDQIELLQQKIRELQR